MRQSKNIRVFKVTCSRNLWQLCGCLRPSLPSYTFFLSFSPLKGELFWTFAFHVRYSTLLHMPPSDYTASEDAGIEPRTVATMALAVRSSNHSARLIHNSARFHPHRLGRTTWVCEHFSLITKCKKILISNMPTHHISRLYFNVELYLKG